jgi:hypothetical protein
VDPSKFKAPFLSKEQIEAEAEALRKKYPSIQKTPVDVLGFAEFDLRLEFDYAPIQQVGLDAILRPDLKGIVFDAAAFREPSSLNRVRFSAAHELGHLFLHKQIYGSLEFKDVEQWVTFIDAIPPDQYQWIEYQAHQFAGYFLIPSKELNLALNEAVLDAEREGFFPQGADEVLEFCCRAIHRDFGVSRQAMQTRIKKSPFWPHSKVTKLGN